MLAQGIEAAALPLIEIRTASDPHGLRHAWQQLAKKPSVFQAVMFVSASAVSHFFIANNSDAHCRKSLESFKDGNCKAWATGQGTVRALLAAGVPAPQIDSPGADSAQWDSESLWAQVSPQLDAVQQVLIVRGADAQGQLQGRDWLAKQLQARGIEVQQVVAYERHLPQWTSAQQALAARGMQGGLWLFSASEAVANLQALMPGTAWQAARALTTHARIAKASKDAGFGVVYESLPGLAQVMASIKSLQ